MSIIESYSTPLNRKRWLMNKTKDELSSMILEAERRQPSEEKAAYLAAMTDVCNHINSLPEMTALQVRKTLYKWCMEQGP